MSLNAKPLTAYQWLLTVEGHPILLVRMESAVAKLYSTDLRPLWLATHVDPNWRTDGSICSMMLREGDPVTPSAVGEAFDMADPVAIPVAAALSEFVNEFVQ